jgi:hypothetical protein
MEDDDEQQRVRNKLLAEGERKMKYFSISPGSNETKFYYGRKYEAIFQASSVRRQIKLLDHSHQVVEMENGMVCTDGE